MSKWYIGAGEQNDIVISTRIRLARNIEDYPFPCKLDTKTRTALNKKNRRRCMRQRESRIYRDENPYSTADSIACRKASDKSRICIVL